MILVTGATGFVGTNLVRELVRRGEPVRILTRSSHVSEGLAGLGIEKVVGDLLEGPALRKALKGCRQVYHVAGLVALSPSRRAEIYRVNVLGTERMMQAALEEGVARLVYTSSAVTLGYGAPEDLVSERSRYNFGWLDIPYFESKKMAEDIVIDYSRRGVPAVIVNPGYIFGAWDRKPRLNKLLTLAAAGRLRFYFGGGLSVVDVADVVQGHLLAMASGRVGESYILSNVNLTYRDFITRVNRLAGRPPPRIRIPTWLLVRLGQVAEVGERFARFEAPIPSALARLYDLHHYLSSKKAAQELGYRPRPLEDSLSDTLAWLKRHRDLP